MSSQQVELKGYALTQADPAKWNDLHVVGFQQEALGASDVEIAITHCGVCDSDVHALKPERGLRIRLLLVVGHEIVGTVTRVGEDVKDFKVGDIAGVGGQRGSCLECYACEDGLEKYCPLRINTYGTEYRAGVVTQGGYSTVIRANERFVFPIPDEIEPRHAASMMCAGLTIFSLLKTHGCGPGKKVGIMNIYGLGHYGILWAKGMGAEVYAFTHEESKFEDIKKMGADHVVNMSKKEYWTDYPKALDILIVTLDVFLDTLPVGKPYAMLNDGGRITRVGGILDDYESRRFQDPFPLEGEGGRKVGGKQDCLEMLELARVKNIRPWIEEMAMKDVGTALQNLKDNKVRYRYVLTQDISKV